MAQSLYDVLGVAPSAGVDEIRRAYIERAREAHPDRHIDVYGAQRVDVERRMQEVNEAWRVLGNARRRRRYVISMAIRTVCFLGAVLVGDGWLRWVLVAAAFILPMAAALYGSRSLFSLLRSRRRAPRNPRSSWAGCLR